MSLSQLYRSTTTLALMLGTRQLVDAALSMSPEVAEQALIDFVRGAALHDALARQQVVDVGGWLGAVRRLYVRMRGKALAFQATGELPTASVCHTLCEAAAVLRRAGQELPTDAESQVIAAGCIRLGGV